MIRKMLIVLPLSFLFALSSLAQESDTAMVLSKNRIVYKGRIYRQNAPYVTFGYGSGYGFRTGLVQQNMNLSYHHFIKGFGLGIGYHASSDLPPWWRSWQKLNDFYLVAGKRWETNRFNLAVFAGPSLARGSYIAWNEVKQKEFAYGFLTPGVYLEAQATYKILYDIGVGLSAYGSLNQEYTVVGGQVHLFFSTSFVRNYD
jgi:hypothetical protein